MAKVGGVITMKSLCGLDCDSCHLHDSCAGCTETGGKPYGGTCVIGECCKKKEASCTCEAWNKAECSCPMKKELIDEYNALGIPDMDPITELWALHGAFINQDYPLPNGKTVRFWEDDRIILGNQVPKKNSDRLYGLAADENYMLLCEYGENGTNPEIIVYRKRKKRKE